MSCQHFKNDSVPSFETLCAELPYRKFEFELISYQFNSELVVQPKQFETLCAELPHRKFEFELVSFKVDSELVVQPKQFCENSTIQKFSLKVKQDFTYNAYHMRVKC